MYIAGNQLVLFQGDSVTDCGRDRADPGSLGGGYAAMTAAWFAAAHPGTPARFMNRGISGNRVKDLQVRWSVDCLDLKPDWLSILIGINDCWRRYDSGDPTGVEGFEAGYRGILEPARKAGIRLVLMEPFVLHITPERASWREDLDPKIAVVRKLAREYSAKLVPLDSMFREACGEREPSFWAADGVHPSAAGHAFISRAWLSAVGA